MHTPITDNIVVRDLMNLKNKKKYDKKTRSYEAYIDKMLLSDTYGFKRYKESDFRDMLNEEKILRQYLESENVDLVVGEKLYSEAFVSTPSHYMAVCLIQPSLDDDPIFRTIALSHEIGHFWDYKYNFDYDCLWFSSELESDEKELKSEVVAWGYAKQALELLGFEYMGEFEEQALEALKTYTNGDEIAATIAYNNMDQYIEERKLNQETCELINKII